MTTIKDLCEKFNVNLDLPEEISNYNMDIPIFDITGHHREKRYGRTIQVFTGEFKDEEIELDFEYVLDNEADEPTFTYISHFKNDPDGPGGFHQITWHKNGTVTDALQ